MRTRRRLAEIASSSVPSLMRPMRVWATSAGEGTNVGSQTRRSASIAQAKKRTPKKTTRLRMLMGSEGWGLEGVGDAHREASHVGVVDEAGTEDIHVEARLEPPRR